MPEKDVAQKQQEPPRSVVWKLKSKRKLATLPESDSAGAQPISHSLHPMALSFSDAQPPWYHLDLHATSHIQRYEPVSGWQKSTTVLQNRIAFTTINRVSLRQLLDKNQAFGTSRQTSKGSSHGSPLCICACACAAPDFFGSGWRESSSFHTSPLF